MKIAYIKNIIINYKSKYIIYISILFIIVLSQFSQRSSWGVTGSDNPLFIKSNSETLSFVNKYGHDIFLTEKNHLGPKLSHNYGSHLNTLQNTIGITKKGLSSNDVQAFKSRRGLGIMENIYLICDTTLGQVNIQANNTHWQKGKCIRPDFVQKTTNDNVQYLTCFYKVDQKPAIGAKKENLALFDMDKPDTG